MLKRRALCLGVGSFSCGDADEAELDGWDPLPFAGARVEALQRQLADVGYTCAPLEAGDLSAAALGERVRSVVRGAGCEDVLVVHVLSHGYRATTALYAVGANGRHDDLSKIENWLGWVEDRQDRDDRPYTLFLLDLCGAGGAARLPWQLEHSITDGRAWVIAAAGPRAPAYDGRFTQAVANALAAIARGEIDVHRSVEYVPLGAVVTWVRAEVNRLAEAAGGYGQQVTATPVDGQYPVLPFFPNPRFRDDPLWRAAAGLDPGIRPFLDLDPGLDAAHFSGRAAGLGPFGDRVGSGCFTGRAEELTALTRWMDCAPASAADRLCVVTGGPGAGKSALLGVVVCAAHPGLRQATRELWRHVAARPSANEHLIAVHARQRGLQEIVASLARQLGIPDSGSVAALLDAFRSLDTPPLVVVDALDEAIDPERLMADLLLPMAQGRGAARLLVGMRPWLEFALLRDLAEESGILVDLDQVPRQRLRDELAAYVTELLELTPGLDRVEHAPVRAAFAGRLAAALAAAATDAPWGEFLAAMLATHRAVMTGALNGDLAQAVRLAEDVPGMLPDVFEAEISAEHAGPWTRPVMTALAYARGDGMPGTVLRRAAAAFTAAGEPTDGELQDALRRARFYLHTSADTDGTTLYRLFHQALADYLHRGDQETAARLLDRLLQEVPASPDGTRQWHASVGEPYLLRHAIQHAADAGRADELLADPEFLVYADAGWLRTRLDDAVSDPARRAVAVYRTSIDKHHSAAPEARRQILAADAARHGNRQLCQQLADPAGLPGLAWTPAWATGSQVSELLRDVLTGPTSWTTRVACSQVDGQPVAVAVSGGGPGGGRGVVAVWDLGTGQLRFPPLTGHTEGVTAVACTSVNGRPVAVTGSIDRTVRVWDLTSGLPCGPALTGHTGTIFAIACTELDGLPIAMTGSEDPRDILRIWDLTSGRPLRPAFSRGSGAIGGLACAVVDGRPVVVAVNWKGIIRMWDVATRRRLNRAVIHPDRRAAFHVACAEFDGRPIAVIASGDGNIRTWWLDQPKPDRQPLASLDTQEFSAVASVELKGRLIALAGSGVLGDGKIRAWDLSTRKPLDLPLTGHSCVRGLASAHLRGRPLVVAGGDDGSVRVWHLGKRRSGRQPIAGHYGSVTAAAYTELNGRPIAVTGGEDGTIRAWDTRRGQPYGRPMTGRGDCIDAIACIELGGRPLAVTSDSDGNCGYGSLQEWDLSTCTPIGPPFGTIDAFGTEEDGDYYSALASTMLNGQPVAVTGNGEGKIQVWDLESRQPIRHPLTSSAKWMEAIACTLLDGRTIAVSAGADPGTMDNIVELWDLTRHRMLGRPRLFPGAAVCALACTKVNDRPIVLLGCFDGTVWEWDLPGCRRLRQYLGKHPGMVTAITCANINDRLTAIVGSYGGPVRMLDLATGTCRELYTPGSVHALAGADGTLIVGSGWEVITYSRRKRARQ